MEKCDGGNAPLERGVMIAREKKEVALREGGSKEDEKEAALKKEGRKESGCRGRRRKMDM
jgi:hypothetical protein